MTALPHVLFISIILLIFSFLILSAASGTSPGLSNVAKKIIVFVMVVSFIGVVVGGYFKINEQNQAVKQKNERIAYNEKKQEELLIEKLKLPIEDILIEPVSKTEYYKITTNTGIYKLAYAYDSNDRVIGFKEFKQITSTIN
ncbi:hypothetical protein PDQ40_22560 [Bacillus cereus group sp. Bc061]|uniref:hypothetical protein n=1 Tax=unclassified Bacillus cereus group TaxID=2750818 RepID=UPI001F562E27|nr:MULTISPECIES: hypothetical protein [unclassified Bacillus cereus group]MDA2598438.1 hypothetical protein [Bacillus cereus group sp. Bc061]